MCKKILRRYDDKHETCNHSISTTDQLWFFLASQPTLFFFFLFKVSCNNIKLLKGCIVSDNLPMTHSNLLPACVTWSCSRFFSPLIKSWDDGNFKNNAIVIVYYTLARDSKLMLYVCSWHFVVVMVLAILLFIQINYMTIFF